MVANQDLMTYLLEEHSPNLLILCSEIVKMLTEYRVYVVNREIKQVCHYKIPKELTLDMEVVKIAVKTLIESNEGKYLTGFAMDFAVIQKKDKGEEQLTALIEVNEGFSIGMHDRLSNKDYTDLLIARRQTLIEQKQ